MIQTETIAGQSGYHIPALRCAGFVLWTGTPSLSRLVAEESARAQKSRIVKAIRLWAIGNWPSAQSQVYELSEGELLILLLNFPGNFAEFISERVSKGGLKELVKRENHQTAKVT